MILSTAEGVFCEGVVGGANVAVPSGRGLRVVCLDNPAWIRFGAAPTVPVANGDACSLYLQTGEVAYVSAEHAARLYVVGVGGTARIFITPTEGRY